MEGPTPVSSLLHSSTMVVARVYLMILIPNKLPIVLRVLLLASDMVGQMDVKKNIAYSTSIHLIMMILLSVSEIYSIVIVYIMVHGIVKGQLFQSSGHEIHSLGSQDMRKFSLKGGTIIMLFAMFMLSALVGMVMLGSKELIVLGGMAVLILVLVRASLFYTIVYGNKLSVVCGVGERERFYIYLIILASMIVVCVNLESWLGFVIVGIVLMSFYRNSMVTVL